MRLLVYGILILLCKWLSIIYEWTFMEVFIRVIGVIIVISSVMGISVLFRMKVSIDVDNERVVKGKRVPVIVDVNNKSLLPVALIRIKMITTNEMYNLDTKCVMEIPVRKWGRQRYIINMIAGSCGNVQIKIDKIKTRDMLGLFFIVKKIKSCCRVVVIPPYIGSDMEEQIDNKNVFIDSDTFSKDKPGDDPSEVYDIRQMKDGDSIRKINWKVSAKKKEYMVNDYSFPIGKGTVIMLDTCINEKKEKAMEIADDMFQKTMEISLFLSESEITHKIVWYNARTKMCDETVIEPEDDVTEVFLKVYQCGIYSGESQLPVMYNMQFESSQISHLYYIGKGYDAQLIEELISGKNNAIKKAYFSDFNMRNEEDKEKLIESLKAFDIEVLR